MADLSDFHASFMRKAIALGRQGMQEGRGGPFGAVVVKKGNIIGQSANRVIETNDPTAHAEVMAIRQACQSLRHFQLSDCTIYTSCEPCPMCLGAIYWARPKRVFYAASQYDAAKIQFDDQFIYDQINTPHQKRSIPMNQLLREDALCLFTEWDARADKIDY